MSTKWANRKYYPPLMRFHMNRFASCYLQVVCLSCNITPSSQLC